MIGTNLVNHLPRVPGNYHGKVQLRCRPTYYLHTATYVTLLLISISISRKLINFFVYKQMNTFLVFWSSATVLNMEIDWPLQTRQFFCPDSNPSHRWTFYHQCYNVVTYFLSVWLLGLFICVSIGFRRMDLLSLSCTTMTTAHIK
jgi:hypothetical protein